MDPTDPLVATFVEERPRLRAVAHRMLGSAAEADDAVQETWLRLARTDVSDVQNLPAWLTTVVSRVCLDALRSRTSRREAPLTDHEPAPVRADAPGHPEREAELADAVGSALLVVLDTLSPAERLAFVLHDLFALPFDEVAGVMGRSTVAVRQLASRARRRVQAPDESTAADRARQREVVEAFLAASRGGDFEALVDLLDPESVVVSDPAAVVMGSPALVSGRQAVAEFFDGRARAARLVLLDGYASAVWSLRGEVKVVFAFTVVDGRVAAIDLLADPELLPTLDLARA
ncbi:MAG: sigma-70 family RNA polymerase sigma factor [Nocardioides sp.]